MIILKHIAGEEIQIKISDADALQIRRALSTDWEIGKVVNAPTFKPITEHVAKSDRKPRGPKAAWIPDPIIVRDILEYFAPGVEATIAKFANGTALPSDVVTRHVKHLVETGALVRVTPKTYRAAVPAGKVAT